MENQYREPVPMIPYDLSRSFAPEEPNLIIPFDRDFNPVPEGETPAGVIEAWLRPLKSGDEVGINNRLIQLNKGKGEVMTGNTEMLRATASTVRIRGLVEDGKPVVKLTEKAYKGFKVWVAALFKEKITELNKGLDTDDADQE